MKKIIENELANESSSDYWKKICKEGEFLKAPRIGEIVKSKVIGVDRSCIFVDLGVVGTGIVYGREFQKGKQFMKGVVQWNA